MGKVKLVVQNRGKEERGCLGTKHERSQRGGLISSGAGSTDLRWSKIPLWADEKIEGWGCGTLSRRSEQDGQRFSLWL